MEIVRIILDSILILGIIGFVLFMKFSFPSYMKEKGKNLATKEDIQEITRMTESVQKELREGFEEFSSDLNFKYEFYYKRYSELYCKLYAIIIQSEYVRHFIKLTDGNEYSFEEIPFLEVSATHKVTQKLDFKVGEPVSFEETVEDIETPISEFRKDKMTDYIIKKGEFASQKLLKLAISYRFAFDHSSAKSNVDSADRDVANDEEIRLIKEIVKCIVIEYNELRKYLKMDYIDSEIQDGILEL